VLINDGTGSSNSEKQLLIILFRSNVNDSISTFVDESNKNNIPHPNIITESEESLLAHHSVLIFEVLETTTFHPGMSRIISMEHDHELAKELFFLWDNFNQSRMLETWHDASR